MTFIFSMDYMLYSYKTLLFSYLEVWVLNFILILSHLFLPVSICIVYISLFSWIFFLPFYFRFIFCQQHVVIFLSHLPFERTFTLFILIFCYDYIMLKFVFHLTYFLFKIYASRFFPVCLFWIDFLVGGVDLSWFFLEWVRG